MVYVLRDEKGRYTGDNAFSYNEESKDYSYSYSDRLVNGFYTYPTEEKALKALEKLQEQVMKIGSDMKFSVQKINMNEVITYECALPAKKHPITSEKVVVRQSVFA